MYIGTGILKVCVNAEIRHKRLQKVELRSRNAKKLNLYYLRYQKTRKWFREVSLFLYGRALSHYIEDAVLTFLTNCVVTDLRKMKNVITTFLTYCVVTDLRKMLKCYYNILTFCVLTMG